MKSVGKFQGQNPRGHRPKGLAAGLSGGLHFTMIHPRLFQGRIRDFFQPMNSLGSPLDIIPGLDIEYC